MTEQVSSLLRKKIPATYINSDLSFDEKSARFSLLSRGAIKLLYLAPERFFVKDEGERQKLKQSKPSFLVVDEAHCVDQWGKDFRREYSRLNEVREKLGSPPVLAFTATAGRDMQQRILKSLGIPDAKVFVRDVDRPNIALLRWRCSEDVRASQIASLLRLPHLKRERAMVFVPSAKVGEKLHSDLIKIGLNVPFYHSRLGTAWDREQLLKRFVGESLPAVNQIICTNAFGMGLDLPNVRLVVHWQQSASVEDLLQELGRAGRDRKQSVSVIFHDRRSQDVSRLKYMADMTVQSSVPEPRQSEIIDHRYRQIELVQSMLVSNSCLRQTMRSYFGQDVGSDRRGLAEVILDWVFGTKLRKTRQFGCCDHCDSDEINKSGPLSYVSTRLRRNDM